MSTNPTCTKEWPLCGTTFRQATMVECWASCTPNFKLLQNREGAQLFDSLFGKGNRVYHTGGYLKKGEMVWLMAKLPNSIRLSDNDTLDTYLLFSNSRTGSLLRGLRAQSVATAGPDLASALGPSTGSLRQAQGERGRTTNDTLMGRSAYTICTVPNTCEERPV